MSISTTSHHHGGNIVKNHLISVPWDPFTGSNGATFKLFAREIYPANTPGAEQRPALLYLQGGPGFPSPRPVETSGWVGEALKHFRIILVDQRGTGRSHRIDKFSPEEDRSATRLAQLRQEYIVEDCEALRTALGIEKWSLLGQSFGGFCITSYLSRHPESVERAYLTGGLPSTKVDIDDVYRATFTKLRYRHEQFYSQFPFAQSRIREICHHLDTSNEVLPTGERLTSRRFRTIGIELGRGTGFPTLAYLVEDPFRTVGGEKRLKSDFLAAVGERVSFEHGPLYAAIHESIYGGIASDMGANVSTNWSAHRIREEFPGFEEETDPQKDAPFYLTGEHIFPWQFDEDPSLHVFKDAAEQLAQKQWDASPYDRIALGNTDHAPKAAAAVYLDDIFVPFELSMDTAQAYADCRVHVTNFYQHNGIRDNGAGLFKILHDKLNDH